MNGVLIKFERKSNIELLRIIAMLMIVAHHYAVHGVINVNDLPGGGTGVFSDGSFVNQVFISICEPGGTIGVGLFFFISGFFLIDKERTHFYKNIVECVYYGIVCGILGFILKIIDPDTFISISSILRSMFDSVSNGDVYWFVSAYILLMMLAPFINNKVQKLSKRYFTLLLLIIWIFPYSVDIFYSGIYSSLIKAIFFYLLGGYIRIYYKNGDNHLILHFFMLIASWLLYAWIFFKFEGNIVNTYDRLARVGNVIGNSITVFAVIALFKLLYNMRLQSKAINFLASTTFGVYLISDNPVLRMTIWQGICKAQDFYLNSTVFIAIAIVSIIAVYLGCTFISSIYKLFIEQLLIDKGKLIFIKGS